MKLVSNPCADGDCHECAIDACGHFCHSKKSLSTHEPPPIHNDGVPIWELVIADMKERDNVGRQRYGTPLQAHNGRDALVDCYQEILDTAVYIRQLIEERKNARAN